jgi:hypothetical protein
LNSQDYDSASEIDEDEKVDVKVTNVKEEVGATQQRAIKLSEIGPRLRLELVKIEEGMCDGKVLYHRYVNKTKVLPSIPRFLYSIPLFTYSLFFVHFSLVPYSLTLIPFSLSPCLSSLDRADNSARKKR